MFVTLVDEKAGTEHPAILVDSTDDGTRGTLVVFYPEFQSTRFVPRIPNGADNAYIDDDGKHGQYFRSGDPEAISTAVSDDSSDDEDIGEDGETEGVTW